jgi:hypothetical protein
LWYYNKEIIIPQGSFPLQGIAGFYKFSVKPYNRGKNAQNTTGLRRNLCKSQKIEKQTKNGLNTCIPVPFVIL